MKKADEIRLSVNITTCVISYNTIIDTVEGYNSLAWTSLHCIMSECLAACTSCSWKNWTSW